VNLKTDPAIMEEPHPRPPDRRRQLDVDDAIRERDRDDRAAFRERLTELRVLLRSIEAASIGLTPRRWQLVVEWLMAVESHADARGHCTAAADRLALTANLTLRQARRARGDAYALELVECGRSYAGEKRSVDRIQVRRAALEALVRAAREARRAGLQPGPQVGCNRSAGGRHVGCTLRKNLRTLRPSKPKPSSTPESLSTMSGGAAPEAPPGASADWGQVVGEVFQCGVNAAEAAVDRVRREGATPADVRALVAWWAERREAWDWPEAVLYRRLCRWAPGQPLEAHWPKPRPGWRDPQEVARDEQLAASRREAAAEQARLEAMRASADAAQRSDLEAAHGAAVDRLSEDEVLERLAGEPFLVKRWRARGLAGVRDVLLERLAGQERGARSEELAARAGGPP
jgi:hypothetical protein